MGHGVDRNETADGSGAAVTPVTAGMFTAKGDLAVGTANAAVDNLAVGANDTILMAASGQATGLKWATPSEVAAAVASGATAETAPAIADKVALYDASAAAGRGMTLENLLKVINLLTAKTKPVRTADYVGGYSAADSASRRILLDDIPLPRSYLAGYGLSNNGSDATNDIDIAVGSCRSKDDTDNILLASAMTKQLDASWAVGTNQGMRATGAAIANGTYHIFVIKRPDTGVVDIAADTSATGANIAANTNAAYTEIRRIGSILRESAAIVGFVQDGDHFTRKSQITSRSGALNTTTELAALDVPNGLRVLAKFSIWYDNSVGSETLYISDPSQTDDAPGATGSAPLSMNSVTGDGRYAVPMMECFTNTSKQIRLRSNGTMNVSIHVYGWTDRRGRDD